MGSDPLLASIGMFGGNYAPRGWVLCDGQLIPISQYSAVFSLLGTTYGGDGRVTFALPDFRGRVPVHVGTGPGLSHYNWGQKGGAEQVTLNSSQMPSHTHQAYGTINAGTSANPTNMVWADTKGKDKEYAAFDTKKAAALSVSAIGLTGGGQPFGIRQPYLAIYFCIATVGIFPSRN